MKFAQAFGIQLIEVEIYKLEEGVFYSKLQCESKNNRISIDARTSDAIALALRFNCPIFTTEDIMSRAGIILDFEKESKVKKAGKKSGSGVPVNIEDKSAPSGELSHYTREDLDKLLDEAVRNEEYEKASAIRDEINRRQH